MRGVFPLHDQITEVSESCIWQWSFFRSCAACSSSASCCSSPASPRAFRAPSKNKSKSLDAKLARATKWVGAVFMVLTLILNML